MLLVNLHMMFDIFPIQVAKKRDVYPFPFIHLHISNQFLHLSSRSLVGFPEILQIFQRFSHDFPNFPQVFPRFSWISIGFPKIFSIFPRIPLDLSTFPWRFSTRFPPRVHGFHVCLSPGHGHFGVAVHQAEAGEVQHPGLCTAAANGDMVKKVQLDPCKVFNGFSNHLRIEATMVFNGDFMVMNGDWPSGKRWHARCLDPGR